MRLLLLLIIMQTKGKLIHVPTSDQNFQRTIIQFQR